MVVRRWVAGLVWVPLVLGAVGCSESSGSTASEPSGDPPPSSSSTPSESASPSGAPSVPPEAVGSDEASAKAFVRYYFEVITAAMQDGDTSWLRELSAQGCESCTGIAELIDDVHEKDGGYRTKGWAVRQVRTGPPFEQGLSFVLSVRESARVLVDAEGSVIDREPSALTPMRIIVRPRDRGWTVERLDLIR
jgi:hypothetical protein